MAISASLGICPAGRGAETSGRFADLSAPAECATEERLSQETGSNPARVRIFVPRNALGPGRDGIHQPVQYTSLRSSARFHRPPAADFAGNCQGTVETDSLRSDLREPTTDSSQLESPSSGKLIADS